MAKETAEQRLLKLIEQTDAQQGGASTAAAPAAVQASAPNEAQKVLDAVQGLGLSSGGDSAGLPLIINKILSFTRALASGGANPAAQTFSLREVNILLMVVVMVAAALAVSSVMKGVAHSRQSLNFQLASVPALKNPLEGLVGTVLPPFRDFGVYADGIARRNIFQPIEVKAPEAEVEVPVVASDARVKEAVADFRLVGVSWLDASDSATAMVEDQKTTITHFLRQGDQLKGVTVDSIYADRVIFKYEGETTSLKM